MLRPCLQSARGRALGDSNRPRRPALLIAPLLVALVALPSARSATASAQSAADDARTAVAARIDALRQQLAQLQPVMHQSFAGFAAGLVRQLDAAAAATEEGLLLAAIGILREAGPPIAGIALHTDRVAGVDGPDAFAALTDEVQARLEASTSGIEAGAWDGKPLILQALGQTSLARVSTLLQGGRAFGVDVADTTNGLIYVGMAVGMVDYVHWLADLPLRSEAPEPAFPGLEGSVAELDARILDAYEDPEAQVQQHPAFIGASAAVKVATGMLRDEHRLAALLAYLDGRRAFAQLDATDGTAPALDALEALDEELARRLGEAGLDHSIGSLYRELAHRRLRAARQASAGEGDEPGELLAGAAVLLRDVVPAYLAVIAGEATTTAATAAADVVVTLVRWPFT